MTFILVFLYQEKITIEIWGSCGGEYYCNSSMRCDARAVSQKRTNIWKSDTACC